MKRVDNRSFQGDDKVLNGSKCFKSKVETELIMSDNRAINGCRYLSSMLKKMIRDINGEIRTIEEPNERSEMGRED